MSSSPSYLTNHETKLTREGLKRKKLEGAKDSSSPLSKLRSATLRSGILGGSNSSKNLNQFNDQVKSSPSKSTANALSLQSSVPTNNNYVSSPLSSPMKQSGSNILNSSGNHGITSLSNSSSNISTPTKNKHQHNTLHRKSMRASMQLKIDEVMKIYAPLTGSEYLTKGINNDKENEPSSPSNTNVLLNNSPTSSPKMSNHQYQHNKSSSTTSTTSSSSTSLSPVLNKLSILSPSSPTSSPIPTTKGKSRKSIQNERLSTIRKQVFENAEFILGRLGEYQRSVLSLPDIFNLTNCDIVHSEYGYLITNTKIITKILSPLDSNSSSETDGKIITSSNPLSPTPINRNMDVSSNNPIVISPSLFSISSVNGHGGIPSPISTTLNNGGAAISSSTTSTTLLSSSTSSSSISSPIFSSNAYSNLNQQHTHNKNNQVFNSLTEMDVVAQSISTIAKKLLGIEIEIKKSGITEKRATILATFIRATRQFIETGIVPEIDIPSELLNSLFLVPSAENITQIYKPEENDYLYKQGTLIKKGKKGPLVVWKDQWITLSPEKLSIHSKGGPSGKLKKEILLNSIVSIVPVTKYEHKYCWMIKVVGGQKFIFRGSNDQDSALWMLAIDGLPRRNFDTNQSCINLYIKETLLETIGITNNSGNTANFRRSVAGGTIRSSHGEEWTYRADGTLFNTDFLDTSIRPKEIKYKWNGQFLVSDSDSQRNLGHGKWNGVWLAWYNPNTNEPFLKYIWDQSNNEYLNQNTKLSFKWSNQRGSLVSKIGNGEWLIEGRIPAPVVMFCQCLRYIRHKELGLD